MDDYISRADAIAYIDRVIKSGLGRCKSLNYIRKYISALPSADAVCREDYHNLVMASNDIDRALREYQAKEETDAVQGEWIRKEREYNDCDGYYAHYWYECSVCGARPPKNQWKNEWHSNYCPSCGARMKGGAE